MLGRGKKTVNDLICLGATLHNLLAGNIVLQRLRMMTESATKRESMCSATKLENKTLARMTSKVNSM